MANLSAWHGWSIIKLDRLENHFQYFIAIGGSFLVGLIIWPALRWLLHVEYDSREPPVIHHKIPFIGHVIGMYRYGAKYVDIVKYVLH